MLKKKDRYVVAIAGASGAVGREMIEILEERRFPVSELVLLDTEDSEGERIEFNDRKLPVKRLTGDVFKGVDIAFFSAGVEISKEFNIELSLILVKSHIQFLFFLKIRNTHIHHRNFFELKFFSGLKSAVTSNQNVFSTFCFVAYKRIYKPESFN